jgi:hypothetical protein
MSDHMQEILQLEGELPVLKERYESSLQSFLALPQDAAHVTDRRNSLQEWHAAGVRYFNAFERLISLGALAGADRDNTWYTDKAETAANLLETIENHYRTLAVKADELRLSRDLFKPSVKAYSNMQRLVKATDNAHATELRGRFASANLPTHGFDTNESKKSDASEGGVYTPALWEKVVCALAAIFVLGLICVIVIRNEPFADPNIAVLVRIFTSLAAAALGSTIPGFLHISWKGQGGLIRAGGALALFVLTYVWTPTILPTPPHQDKGTSLLLRDERAGQHLELSDVMSELKSPELPAEPLTLVDVKVRNRGNETAYITRAVFQVEKIWEFRPFFRRNYIYVPSSKEYEVKLAIDNLAPVEKAISHAIKSQEVDRFQFRIIPFVTKKGKGGTPFDVVYMLRVSIIFDKSNRRYCQ